MRIAQDLLDRIVAHARREFPNECCGLIAVRDGVVTAVDEALGRILAALPAGTDILIVSPSGMGPNTSRSHVLPGMLQAVMNGKQVSPKAGHSSVMLTGPTRRRL